MSNLGGKPRKPPTQKQVERLADAMARLPVSLAFDLVGIDRSYWPRWCEYAAQGDKSFIGVVAKLRAARAGKAAKSLQAIEEAGADRNHAGVAAQTWIATRLFPRELGDRKTVATHKTTDPDQQGKIDPDAFRQETERLERGGPGEGVPGDEG